MYNNYEMRKLCLQGFQMDMYMPDGEDQKEIIRNELQTILPPYITRIQELLDIARYALEAGIPMENYFRVGVYEDKPKAPYQLYILNSEIYVSPLCVGFTIPSEDPGREYQPCWQRYTFRCSGERTCIWDKKRNCSHLPPIWAAKHFVEQFDSFESAFYKDIDTVMAHWPKPLRR